jgi:hypothetical protein
MPKNRKKKKHKDKTQDFMDVAAVREKVPVFCDALEHPNDIVCAIVVTSCIDAALGALLKEFFVDSSRVTDILDEGILSTFRARSDIAYLIGILPKFHKETIDQIGEIRNLIGHQTEHHTFDDPVIRPLCEALRVPEMVFLNDALQDWDPNVALGTTRKRFQTIAGTMFMDTYMTAKALREYKESRTPSLYIDRLSHKPPGYVGFNERGYQGVPVR